MKTDMGEGKECSSFLQFTAALLPNAQLSFAKKSDYVCMPNSFLIREAPAVWENGPQIVNTFLLNSRAQMSSRKNSPVPHYSGMMNMNVCAFKPQLGS